MFKRVGSDLFTVVGEGGRVRNLSFCFFLGRSVLIEVCDIFSGSLRVMLFIFGVVVRVGRVIVGVG